MSNHDQTPDEWETSYTDGALESWELQVSPWPNCLGLIERCQHITVMCPWAERCQLLTDRRRGNEAQHLAPDPDDGPFEDIDDDEIIGIFNESAEGEEFADEDPFYEVERKDGIVRLIVEDKRYPVDHPLSRREYIVAGSTPGVGGSGIDFEEE